MNEKENVGCLIGFFTSKASCVYNLGDNICRLLHFLAQFLFTTSETELHYYHHTVNVIVTSQVAERL